MCYRICLLSLRFSSNNSMARGCTAWLKHTQQDTRTGDAQVEAVVPRALVHSRELPDRESCDARRRNGQRMYTARRRENRLTNDVDNRRARRRIIHFRGGRAKAQADQCALKVRRRQGARRPRAVQEGCVTPPPRSGLALTRALPPQGITTSHRISACRRPARRSRPRRQSC